MPMTFYTQEEYQALQDERIKLWKQVEVLEQLRPVWAQYPGDLAVSASCYANALSELWKLLEASNQTQAVRRLHDLLGDM